MNAIKITLLATALLAPAVSFAGKVEATDNGTSLKVKSDKKTVEVSENLQVVVEDEKTDAVLKLSGASNRKNPLGHSYTVRSYIAPDQTLSAAKVLEELGAMKVKALRLNITFFLPKDTLRDRFAASLKTNDLYVADDPKTGGKTDPDIKALFDQLTFGVRPGDMIDFISITRVDGNDVVYIVVKSKGTDAPKGPLMGVGKDLGLKFWKIWFGKTGTDTDMARVQKELISNTP